MINDIHRQALKKVSLLEQWKRIEEIENKWATYYISNKRNIAAVYVNAKAIDVQTDGIGRTYFLHKGERFYISVLFNKYWSEVRNEEDLLIAREKRERYKEFANKQSIRLTESNTYLTTLAERKMHAKAIYQAMMWGYDN